MDPVIYGCKTDPEPGGGDKQRQKSGDLPTKLKDLCFNAIHSKLLY